MPACRTDRTGVIGAFLDPQEGRRRAIRAIPALRDDSARIVGFRPERFEVSESGVALQATLDVWHPASSDQEALPVWIGEGASPEPGNRFAGQDVESGAILRLSPADPALPALTEILSPPYRRRLRRAVGLEGENRDVRVDVLSHRFGKRITLGVRPADAPAPELLLKLYAGDGDSLLERALDVAGDCDGPISIPRVLQRDPDRRLVGLEWLPGSPLRERWSRHAPPVGAAAAQAIRHYQTRSAVDLEPYDHHDEIRTIRKFSARVAALRPHLARAIEDETSAAEDAAARVHEPFALAHRDLHDGQLILGSARLALIDWDFAARSPCGLDAGNFLAHLRLRMLQGRATPQRIAAERRAFLASFGASSAVRFWENLALVRLAAVYGLRANWPGLADRILAEVRGEGGLR